MSSQHFDEMRPASRERSGTQATGLVVFEIEIVLIDHTIDELLSIKNVARPVQRDRITERNRYHAIREEIVLELQPSAIDVEQDHTDGAEGHV